MLKILVGANEYAIAQRLAEISKDKSVKKLWAEDTTAADVVEAGAAQSLFDDPVDIVIVRRLQDNTGLAGDLAERLDQISNVDLVITADKVDKRGRLYKAAKKDGTVEEFADLKPADLQRFATDQLKASNIDTNLARALAERCQTQAAVASAVSMLAIAADDKGQINKDRFEQLVPPTAADNIFAFLDQVLSGNSQSAVKKYDELLAANLEPGYIAAMIVWQVANIAGAGIAGPRGARDLKMNPYVFDKSRRVATRLSKPQLQTVVNLTAEYEQTFKSTSTDLTQLTRQLLHSLATV